ncbi:hypothetical protein GCM10027258_85590 [Amycolatopsis stemonae]
MASRTPFPPPPARLVGRRRELARFAAGRRQAADGRGHALLVRGPAGIGKTSLVAAALHETAAALPAAGRILTAAASRQGANTAYGVVRELFEPLGLDGEAGESLLRGSARFARHALTTDAAAEPPAVGSYAVQHGLYWLAATLATPGPLVLAVDDVQWCDESSLRWLEFLVRRAPDLPLLVVLAQRSGTAATADGTLAEIEGAHDTRTLDLGPLPLDAVAELIPEPLATPDGLFARTCLEETGGNPLLLRRMLGELTRARSDDERVSLSSLAGSGRAVLATSTLDRLSAPTRAVAMAVAVLGNDEPGLLAKLAEVPGAVVSAALETLWAHEILRDGTRDFVHELVRAAILDAGGAGEPARWHRRAARLLSDAGRPAEDVAGHLLLLPEIDEWWMAGILREAAKSATGRGAPGTAARYLRRAQAFQPDDVGLLLELATALAPAEPIAAFELLERARGLAADVREEARIAVRLGMVALAVQRAPEAVAVLREVTGQLDERLGEPRSVADAGLRTMTESMLLITGLDEKATVPAAFARVRAQDPPAGDDPAECQLLGMRAAAHALEGGSAVAAAAEASRALRVDPVGLGGWAALGAGLALQLADELKPAQDALGRLIEHASGAGDAWTYCLAQCTRAMFWHWAGDLTEAGADAQVSYDLAHQESWGKTATMPQIALATVLAPRGDGALAETLLDGITRPRLDHFALEYHWYLMARAMARAALGDREGALRYLRTCGESLAGAGMANPVFAPWWLEGACLLAEDGRLDEGRELAGHGQALATRWGTPRAVGMGLLAAGVTTRGDEGVDLLAEAVRTLDGGPGLREHQRAEYLLGRALLARDDRKGAREHLRRAVDGCTRTGDRLLLDAARAALLEAGGRPRAASGSALDTLTGSERRVAELAAGGDGNRAIAEALFVTVRTVEMHLTSVYRKLNVGGRADLAAALTRREAG